MSLNVKIQTEALGTIELSDDSVDKVIFDTDTPNDSNDRSKDLAIGFTIMGKIRRGKVVADDTLNLPKWAMIRGDENCYASITVTVTGPTGITIRQTTLPNVFVTTYTEKFDLSEDANGIGGVGTFVLKVKEVVDDNKSVTCQGGF